MKPENVSLGQLVRRLVRVCTRLTVASSLLRYPGEVVFVSS